MLAEKITKKLQELKWTQADLVRKTGLASSHVSYLCSGERGSRVSLETLKKLSTAFNVPLDFFSDENSHLGEMTTSSAG
ncbi:helix-turn-helix domain-containing protein [Deinococcus cellulosilyticus]|uniref:HTH cro/C1-type domain-containing protein n=1 Tax=Deinococcus cellulosilyticus (strain DSM 18568 / NBRC 106333 / KACC 11606 / 5516J-15) TaxID=1223518 RepID=A0A511N7H3_DEIC1|nr:hypothetical protein DC3_44340 [Deinococcus cellulosilyticus NBRC 106333 = KACC 11606]